MRPLDDPAVRRALLVLIIDGASHRGACAEVGVPRSSLTRYCKTNLRFHEQIRESIAFRGRPDHEVAAFLIHVAPPPVQDLLRHISPPEVVDAEVVDDTADDAPRSSRSKAAFYDRLWDRFDDKNTPLILQVESTRALERHYLREDVLGPQAAAAPRRPRGLSAVAKRKTLHEIIGPRPEASADEDEGVA